MVGEIASSRWVAAIASSASETDSAATAAAGGDYKSGEKDVGESNHPVGEHDRQVIAIVLAIFRVWAGVAPHRVHPHVACHFVSS